MSCRVSIMSILCRAINFLGKGTHHYGKWHIDLRNGGVFSGFTENIPAETTGTISPKRVAQYHRNGWHNDLRNSHPGRGSLKYTADGASLMVR